jgi:hypothetical protein
MPQPLYHGILVDFAFTNHEYPERYDLFAKQRSDDGEWQLFGVEVKPELLHELISEIQAEMKDDAPYYVHLYNDEELVIVFKNRVFRFTEGPETWSPAKFYAKGLGVPEDQLDFFPNQFSQEQGYFKPESFLGDEVI